MMSSVINFTNSQTLKFLRASFVILPFLFKKGHTNAKIWIKLSFIKNDDEKLKKVNSEGETTLTQYIIIKPLYNLPIVLNLINIV